MQLDQIVMDALVIPWVQDLANGDAPPPDLTLTGTQLAPTVGSWQPGASVTVVESGGSYDVTARYDGLDQTVTVQPNQR